MGLIQTYFVLYIMIVGDIFTNNGISFDETFNTLKANSELELNSYEIGKLKFSYMA